MSGARPWLRVFRAECAGLLLLGVQDILHSVLMITAPLFQQAAVVIGLVLWSPGLPALQSHRALQLSDSSQLNSCSLSLFLAGCEFFKEYKDRDYTAEGLIFNWKQVLEYLQNRELRALLG